MELTFGGSAPKTKRNFLKTINLRKGPIGMTI